MPGPSSETERRAQLSMNECSGETPSDRTLFSNAELELVSRAGVERDSSWATKSGRQGVITNALDDSSEWEGVQTTTGHAAQSYRMGGAVRLGLEAYLFGTPDDQRWANKVSNTFSPPTHTHTHRQKLDRTVCRVNRGGDSRSKAQ